MTADRNTGQEAAARTGPMFSDLELIDYVYSTYSDRMADEVERLLIQERDTAFARFVRRSLMREMHWKATNV